MPTSRAVSVRYLDHGLLPKSLVYVFLQAAVVLNEVCANLHPTCNHTDAHKSRSCKFESQIPGTELWIVQQGAHCIISHGCQAVAIPAILGGGNSLLRPSPALKHGVVQRGGSSSSSSRLQEHLIWGETPDSAFRAARLKTNTQIRCPASVGPNASLQRQTTDRNILATKKTVQARLYMLVPQESLAISPCKLR